MNSLMGFLSTWHLIRASGVVAYILLSVSAFSGIACSAPFISSRGRINLINLHEASSRWSLWLVLTHAALLMVDTYAPYSLVAVLWPLLGPYRPWAVMLGSIAAWLMLGTLLAFDLRSLINERFRRMVHGLNVVVYVAATLHGIWSGTDTSHVSLAVMYGGSALSIGVMVLLRLKGAKQVAVTGR